MIKSKKTKKISPLEKELQILKKQECAFLKKYSDKNDSKINQIIEGVIPGKVQGTLESAFSKAFYLIFEKGTGIIEKTYKKDQILEDYDINMYAAERKNTKKEWRAFSKKSAVSANKNLLVSGASGIGMGFLGIGVPDIVWYIGLQLRSIYEIALNNGFSYEEEQEQRFILSLFCGALSYGKKQRAINSEINYFIEHNEFSSEKDIKQCIEETASCMSKELLYMKFLQSIPIVGTVGGAFDIICMQRINKYAELKYRRRFLYSHFMREDS